ncbi:MAG: hypothetical protein HY509_04220 [Acidobacteria bacterium]|nr:hypothetical protein [Acidobacteriota bacterium]
MFSIDDERLDDVLGRVDRWFLVFVVVFFIIDAAITYRFAKTVFGWLLQVIATAGLLFPVSYAFGYLAFLMGGKLGASTRALRTVGAVVVGIVGLCLIWYVVGFLLRPSAYETGLIGLVVPLGFAGATMKFWDHALR